MKIVVGSQVAFNKLADAVWFDVLEIKGPLLIVREQGTNYASQTIDKCFVQQVKKGK